MIGRRKVLPVSAVNCQYRKIFKNRPKTKSDRTERITAKSISRCHEKTSDCNEVAQWKGNWNRHSLLTFYFGTRLINLVSFTWTVMPTLLRTVVNNLISQSISIIKKDSIVLLWLNYLYSIQSTIVALLLLWALFFICHFNQFHRPYIWTLLLGAMISNDFFKATATVMSLSLGFPPYFLS